MTIDRGLLDKAINIINNVGNYGPLDATIDSYKQAADYADDARLYSELAASGVDNINTQIRRVTELAETVEDLEKKVETSFEKVTTLDVDATDGTSVSATYDKTENKIHFVIPAGKDGVDGKNGTNGTNGTNGKSAYQLAVDAGYTGTLQEFNDLNTKSLDKSKNLSDVANGTSARTNLSVYSKAEVASLLTAKAGNGANSDITSLNGLSTAITVAQGGTGSKNAAGARANLGLNNLANPNLFMNGNFALWQRGATFVNPPHFTPTVSRWVFGQSSGSAEFTISRDDDVPNLQSAFSMKILTTKAYTPQSMDEAHIRHAIEGRYDTDSVAGKVLTLSFWAKSNVVGKHGVVFVKPNSERTEEYTFCGSYTISTADTWEYKTVLVDTTQCPNKTWYRGSEYGLKFRFTFYAGTGYSSTENAWNLGNFVGVNGGVNLASAVNNYLKVSQVKLEASPYATPFIPEPISETVRKVNRYEYLIADNSGSSTAGSIGWTGYSSQANESSYATIPLPIPMRKAPTVTAVGGWTYGGNTQQSMSFVSGTTSAIVEFKGTAAGRTAVRSVNGCQILFDAEM